MTKAYLYTIIVGLSIILTGCGSSDFSSTGNYDDEYTETGGSGTDVETGGSSHHVVTSDGGTGNTENTGGSDGTGGDDMMGSGGSDTCVPETCEEIGARLSGVAGHSACGIVTNNCGTQVDCSPTTCDRYQECGVPIWDMNSPGEVTGEEWYAQAGVIGYEIYDRFLDENYPSVCGEECVNITTQAYNLCPDNYPVATLCANGVVPDDDCLDSSSSAFCCVSSGRYQPYN